MSYYLKLKSESEYRAAKLDHAYKPSAQNAERIISTGIWARHWDRVYQAGQKRR